MPIPERPPREGLRAIFPGAELRDAEADGGMPTMTGHFAVFNQWTEINSVVEGRFMERIAPGAFARTFNNNRDKMRVTFQHGRDPQLGDKPLGPISELREDGKGAYYEVPLLDTSYNKDLLPALQAGLYGSSFRFNVLKDEWNPNSKSKVSATNPSGLPERTLTEVNVPEFGPVTFPAYSGASAGVRSLTDVYVLDQFTRDPERLAELIDSIPGATALPHDGPDESHSDEGTRESPPEPPPVPKPSPVKEQAMDPVSRTDRPARIEEIKREVETITRENSGVYASDVQARWDELTAELTKLEADDRADQEHLDFIEARGASEQHVEREQPKPRTAPNQIREAIRDIYDLTAIRNASRSEEHERQLLQDSAMRAVETATFPMEQLDKARASDQVDNLLRSDTSGDVARRILTTGAPAYRRFFHKTVLGQMTSQEEQRAAAMTSLTGSSGGFATVWELDPTILPTSNGAVNPYRRMARVVQTTTNEWRGVTSTGVVAAYAAEAASATEQGPTLVQPAAIVQKAHTYITFSIEAGEDINNLDGQLGTMISDAKDVLEAVQFTTGVGTTVFPEGIMVGATASATNTATTTVLAAGDLYNLETALAPRFRPNARFVANRFIYNKIRAIDTAGGAQLWTQNLTVGLPNRVDGNTGYNLLGYPADECSGMAASVASGQDLIILGDFRYFVIVDRIGLNIEMVPLVTSGATPNFPTGQRGLYAYWRNTSKVLSATAFNYLNGV